MTTRLAEPADIPQIMSLIGNVVPTMNAAGNFQWDHTYPNAEAFTKDIEQQQLWLALIDNKIAGIAAITTDQYPEYAEVGLNINETAIVVHRLAVDPAYQGKGVAKFLMQKAEDLAIDRHIGVLRIDTNSKNVTTQALFLKLGYRFAGEMGLSFRPDMRFYCYEKRLDKKPV
jgi:GNAT superfamily N-acetyltransferase